MTKLPIGIQTFSKIREDNYAYVDKTKDIYDLVDRGIYYFLSRPRRFGKSLLIDTISELFKGRKEYFKGLYIYDKWDWSVKYPVIKISFVSGDFQNSEVLKDEISNNLEDICDDLGIEYDIRFTLKKLIRTVSKKYNQKVVILVDEYDKPVIDVITDRDVAEQNRTILGNLYSAIKDSDQYVKFAMLTGVSKFSQMSLFSKLNNLEDITIDEEYGTITGYTQHDLETTFKEHLEGVDMDKVKRWYNGYNYLSEPIYNPYDILIFIKKKCIFDNYWWQSGNPSFLIDILKRSNFYLPNLDNLIVGKETLNAFDVERIDIVALLWQTGYLTFDKKITEGNFSSYKMKIPNLEVKQSLNTLFLNYLAKDNIQLNPIGAKAVNALLNNNVEKLFIVLKSLFATIANNNFIKNSLAHYEGYYASIMYTFLSSLGFDSHAEDVTNIGRIDLTLKTDSTIYIFEFKVDRKEDAITQIKDKKYYEKYQSDNKDIYLIGINFISTEKNISEFKWEKVE